MRKFTISLFFLPLALNAQLDRVRTNMTEPEFIKAFPEAHRDYESEAIWVSSIDTIEGASGNSMWRVYKDSISEYGFRSLKVDGPSYRFTTVDSSRVHKLRVSAMKLKEDLEKKFGTATIFISNGLLDRPLDPVGNHSPGMQTAAFKEVIRAEWIFDDGKIIVLRVSTEMSPGNMINAPANQQTQKSESYEFEITVTRPTPVGIWNFEVGSSTAQFEGRHPGVLGVFGIEHIYGINDSATTPNAYWQFIFRKSVLVAFHYRAYASTGDGAKSDSAAYLVLRLKVVRLIGEGNAAFGIADTIWSELPSKYIDHDRHIAYNLHYVHAKWKTQNGSVIMIMDEIGGGKNPSAIFILSVQFGEYE